MNPDQQTATDFRVGLMSFTAICFVVLGITFAGGDKGLLFRETASLRAHLNNVGGLKTGSSVTIGGMPIGKVDRVTMVSPEGRNKIEVLMTVRQDVTNKIKKDSTPIIKTQGMLGDRYLEISEGSAEAPPITPEDILQGTGSADFDRTLQQANDTLLETAKLLTAINSREGTAGRLIYTDELHQNINEIAEQTKEILADFKENPKRYIKLRVF